MLSFLCANFFKINAALVLSSFLDYLCLHIFCYYSAVVCSIYIYIYIAAFVFLYICGLIQIPNLSMSHLPNLKLYWSNKDSVHKMAVVIRDGTLAHWVTHSVGVSLRTSR